MYRFNPKREDDIDDEALELQFYDRHQHTQFQSLDISEHLFVTFLNHDLTHTRITDTFPRRLTSFIVIFYRIL